MTDALIKKLDELRALVDKDAAAISFSINTDVSGTSYTYNISDAKGGSMSESKRIPK